MQHVVGRLVRLHFAAHGRALIPARGTRFLRGASAFNQAPTSGIAGFSAVKLSSVLEHLGRVYVDFVDFFCAKSPKSRGAVIERGWWSLLGSTE